MNRGDLIVKELRKASECAEAQHNSDSCSSQWHDAEELPAIPRKHRDSVDWSENRGSQEDPGNKR